jgi:ribosomal protection tetracycline resistance protein
MATVGLRVEPGPHDSGVSFRLDIDERSIPLYVYKSQSRFIDQMSEYVRRALTRGLFGWEVTDCVLTLTDCDYYSSDGPTKPTVAMTRTASKDFRLLTPIVLTRALQHAGAGVCEPVMRLRIESPSNSVGEVLHLVAQLGGSIQETDLYRGDSSVVQATMAVDRLREFQRTLPDISGGEGSFDSEFQGYRPVLGRSPRRT